MRFRNNSKYVENKNKLNKRKGDFVEIYVENEVDIPFWQYFFSKQDIQTKVFPASHTAERGKDAVLKKINDVGNRLLLCIDSDFDDLLDKYDEKVKKAIEQNFVFQTYTYSLENCQCYAPALPQVITEITHIGNEVLFDFESFLANYSTKIYDFFILFLYFEKKFCQELNNFLIEKAQKKEIFLDEEWKLWSEENQPKRKISSSDFHDIISKDLDTSNLQQIETFFFEKITQKINAKTAELQNLVLVAESELKKLKKECKKKGLKPENAYLFMQGHALLENIVIKILNKIQSFGRENKKAIFDNLVENETEIGKKDNAQKVKSQYMKNLPNALHILTTHKNYLNAFFIKKLQKDIKNFKIKYYSPTKS